MKWRAGSVDFQPTISQVISQLVRRSPFKAFNGEPTPTRSNVGRGCQGSWPVVVVASAVVVIVCSAVDTSAVVVSMAVVVSSVVGVRVAAVVSLDMVSTRIVSFGVPSVVDTSLVVESAEVIVTLVEVASPSVVGGSVVVTSVPVVVMSVVIVTSPSMKVSVDTASSSVVEDNSIVEVSVLVVGVIASTSLVTVSTAVMENPVVVSEAVSVAKSVCPDVVSMVVESPRSEAVTIPSDSDVLAASLEIGADVVADETARRVVLAVATSRIVEVERSRVEVSSYMSETLWERPDLLRDCLPELRGRGLQTLATAALAAKATEQRKTPRITKEELLTINSTLRTKEETS